MKMQKNIWISLWARLSSTIPLFLLRHSQTFYPQSLHTFQPTHLDNNFFQDLLLTMRRTSHTPYASFHTLSIADDLSVLSVVDPPPSLAAELQNFRRVHYDPSLKDWSRGSLIKRSLLSITDDFSYTGHKFEHWKICTPVLATCSLGEETFTMEMCQYQHSYMLSLKPGVPRPTVTDESMVPGIPDPTLQTNNHINYEDVPPSTNVTCATHSYGIKDCDSPEMWSEIINYLKMDVMPDRCKDPVECKSFVRKTKNFFLHDGDCLWKIELKGRIPCLVVVDTDHHSELIAEAHNNVGHRGRDTTYKTLAECFFWPNMFNQIAYFICSCNICQLHSKTHPIVAFSPTWNSGILRHFNLDTYARWLWRYEVLVTGY